MSNNGNHTSIGGRALITAAAVVLLVIATVITVLIRANRHDSRRASPAASPTATSSSAGPSAQPASSTPTTSSPAGSPTTGSATASQTTGAPVALLPRGQEAPRASIPWSQVNDGWSLHPWTSATDAKALINASRTLYLINPIGGRYNVGTLPPDAGLALWSPDHRRAIIDFVRVAGRDYIQEWDLSTGRVLTSFVQAYRTLLGYTRPLGLALLTRPHTPANQTSRLERIGTDGSHQQDYPGSLPAVGQFERPVLYTADGSQFLIAGGRGFALFSNGGKLLRQIPNPARAGYCFLAHWWSDREALASCSTGIGTGSENLFRIPIDGTASTQLTFAAPPNYGFTNGWKFNGGILAQRASSCGPGGLATISPNGKAQPLHYQLPPGVSGQPSVTGVYQDQATLVTGLCGQPGRSLFSLNLRTGATSTLLGAGLNGGTVY